MTVLGVGKGYGLIGKVHCNVPGSNSRVALCGTSENQEFHITPRLFTDLLTREDRVTELCEECIAHPDVMLYLLGMDR